MKNPVTIRRTADTTCLQIDDGKANAMSPDLIASINDALDRVDPDTGSLIIQGREGCFCGGFDLKILNESKVLAKDMVEQGWRLWLKLFNFPRPVIAAVNGHAIGFGAFLTLACDHVIAAEGEYFVGFNEITNNIPLSDKPAFLTPISMRVLPQHQTEVILHAKLFNPAGALEVGLCHQVVTADGLIEASLETANRLSSLPNPAYAQTKSAWRKDCSAEIKEAVEGLDLPSRLSQLASGGA